MDALIKNHFQNLYAIALSDSNFHEEEILLLYRIGEEQGLVKSDIDELIASSDVFQFDPPENIDEKIRFLYDYSRMILSDNQVDEAEKKLLEKYCLRFGFIEENVNDICTLLLEAARQKLSPEELLLFITSKA
jgi:hypothetical protein